MVLFFSKTYRRMPTLSVLAVHFTSILFGATDISLLRTPLWIPQGLWAFGIAVFLLLIVLLLVESTLLVLAGRGREAEALVHARTYQEEAAEALEAVGAPTKDGA